ncbi:unnamed protein product [Clonostachys chloroleuca]|uniref:Uncharacterized protein n=1 Tax=Clonostachys chloroleuca TaxID=1926264 RepID=A0AA35LSR7_9HYPO|nr:unnamed protein product [Clonostachys chloroleuca]
MKSNIQISASDRIKCHENACLATPDLVLILFRFCKSQVNKSLLIKGKILALLTGLGLDALLRSEALPFGGFLGLGDGLLSWQVCAGWWKREEDAFLGGAEGAGRQQLVDQGLSSVARDLGERLLDGGVIEDDWIGVLCH